MGNSIKVNVPLEYGELKIIVRALLVYSERLDQKILEFGRNGSPQSETHDLQADCLASDALRLKLRGYI